MKKLNKKMFYAFIVTAMMFSVSANAQIVYTDVNPNIVLSCFFSGPSSVNYSLDLNNDGINDFILSARKQQIGCSCGPGHGRGGGASGPYADKDSAVISSTSQSWIADQVGGYPLNTLIDASLGWTNAIHTLSKGSASCQACTNGGGNLIYLSASAPWSNINGKYLALKTQVGTDFYYGWVKLGVGIGTNTVSITIMEYAYNSIPNQPILAGQTNTSGIIENSFASSINLFPNPATNHLTIALGSNNKKVQVTIADITGKVIYTTIATDTQKVEVNTEDFKEGIYLVQIQSADFIATKKLVVEK